MPLTDFPNRGWSMPPVVSTTSRVALGYEWADASALDGTPASVAWGTANLVLFVPFEVTEPITITKLAWYNGSTANGNVDMGIFSLNGTFLFGAGNTAQAGTSALQEVNITDTLLTEGVYFMGLKCESTTATVWVIPWAGTNFPGASVTFQATGAAGSLTGTYTLADRTPAAGIPNSPFMGFCIGPRTLLA